MRALVLALLLGLGAPAAAQAPEASSLVVIDRETVLASTSLGRTLLSELEEASTALANENREIEAELTSEEEELTRRRPDLPASEFRALADAFDARVQAIRETQDAKTRDLLAQRERLGDRFWDRVLPILGEVAAARGALVVLDRSAVFLSSDAVDITDETIARIDAAIGPIQGPPAP